MRARILALGLALVAPWSTSLRAQHGGSPPPEPRFTAEQSVGLATGLLPLGVTSFGAAAAGGFAWVLGGYFGEPHNYLTRHQSRAFYRFPLIAPGDVEILPDDDRIQSVGLVPFRGSVARFGGMSIVDDQTRSVDVCRWFDPVAREWTDLPALPAPRSSHQAVVVGERVFLAGGWALDADSASAPWCAEMWSLDLAQPASGWQVHPQPFQRRALGGAALGSALVWIGGMDVDGEVSSSVDVFDSATGTWSRGPDYPGFGFGVAAATANGRIHASGAEGVVWSWMPGETSWTQVGTLTFPRFFHQLLPGANGDLLALGGINRGLRTRHVESLPLTPRPTDGAALALRHWTVPTPGTARNRQGIFLHGDSLYAFGGNNSPEQHDFAADNFVAEGWRLDLPTLAITTTAAFPARMQSMHTAVSAGGRSGFSVGGFGHDGTDARSQTGVYQYDFKNDRWSAEAPLPVALSQFGLALHERELWLFGGLDFDPTRPRDDRFRHSLRVLRWKTGSEQGFVDAGVALTTPRRAFAGALLGDRYYLVGGMREDFELVEACEVFDFSAAAFSALPAPAKPRLSGELVALDGRLFLIGGSSPDRDGELVQNPSIEMFDPATNQWTLALERLPIAPRQLRAFAYRGQLLVYSAQVRAQAIDVLLIQPPLHSTSSP